MLRVSDVAEEEGAAVADEEIAQCVRDLLVREQAARKQPVPSQPVCRSNIALYSLFSIAARPPGGSSSLSMQRLEGGQPG